MGNRISECRAENVLIHLSVLVGIWQGFCLHQDLSKPAGSAETPKEALDFQQAPWHFPGSAASRTLAVDLQWDTCFTSALSPCQREVQSTMHDCKLVQGAGSWVTCCCVQWVSLEVPSKFCREVTFFITFSIPFDFYLQAFCRWAG